MEMAYRRQGVGRALLEEGCRVVMAEKGCGGMVFAEDHASESQFFLFIAGIGVWALLISCMKDSTRVLPRLFNGYFDRREEKARRSLEGFVQAERLAARER